jgi:glycosyltransferase involved in cell wall biosynthesis
MSPYYEIILYSSEQNEVENVHQIPIIEEAERYSWFGDGFNTVTTPLDWNPEQPYWKTMNKRAIQEIIPRSNEGDYLLLIAGICQKPIADQVGNLIPLEWGVGYEGIFSQYCAFESYAWMHYVYARNNIVNGRSYDAVIPNFFDRDDFQLSESRGDYLLYLGRVVERKGPHVASLIAERLGRKLVVAGPGGIDYTPGRLRTTEGLNMSYDNLEYVGEVDSRTRAELLAGADALIVPTLYIEPFGGASIEAMFAGTPVVASDWGAFTETITPEVGRRFRTLGEAADAVNEAVNLDRAAIRQHAIDNYSLEAIHPKYAEWFTRLQSLWGAGWYA